MLFLWKILRTYEMDCFISKNVLTLFPENTNVLRSAAYSLHILINTIQKQWFPEQYTKTIIRIHQKEIA